MDDVTNNNHITSDYQIDETITTGTSLNENLVPKSKKVNHEIKHSVLNLKNSGVKKSKSKSDSSKKKSKTSKGDNSKFRRMACRACEGCLQDDCGTCLYCLDKPKFGGNDIKKQKCLKRRCLFLKQ
ncbi:nuclear receptor-like protein [Euroglyphus maynei]|uniref:Nuclear receptor-like protein n=1 Tax=Euroglyphus maynei TaxID=6958 RepID=A0A1Y3AS45_EURMA|nr:nuclear receptor-like protein [Euroglyphus maynei]